jgi:hypothetical protein
MTGRREGGYYLPLCLPVEGDSLRTVHIIFFLLSNTCRGSRERTHFEGTSGTIKATVSCLHL